MSIVLPDGHISWIFRQYFTNYSPSCHWLLSSWLLVFGCGLLVYAGGSKLITRDSAADGFCLASFISTGYLTPYLI